MSLVLSLLAAASLVAGRDDHTAPRNATVDARGATLVRVIARAGSLDITGRDGGTAVTVRGTARASEAAWLADIRLDARRDGDVVTIEVLIPDWNGPRNWTGEQVRALDLDIDVPAGARLQVQDSSGDLEITHVGAVDVDDGSGDVTIARVRGDVTVRDGSGAVTVREVGGTLLVAEDGSGDVDVRTVGGAVRVARDGSGSIRVSDVTGDFTVERDGSGGIDHRGVKGTVRVPRSRRGR